MADPVHGFPRAEFETRLARAQALMQEARLDAVLVTSPPNVRYFSGLDMQFWESPTRPWYLLAPREGEPIAVMPELGAPAVAMTWVKDLRSWPAPVPEDDGISLLKGAISGLQRRFGRIGAELGREMSLRMPVIDLERLRRELSGIEIVDGSPLVWRARMIKTPAEIDRIRLICRIASRGYEALTGLVKLGDSERDAARKLRLEMTRHGADAVPFLPAISGHQGVSQIVVGPTDRKLERGDILFLDTGATFDGYFCDFDRNYAIGPLEDATRRAHEALWQATEAGIAAAVPGATTDDVWRAMAGILEAAGSRGNNVGRLGHGLGLQLTEPPSFKPGDGTRIEPGMVLTIEPGMEFAPGRMIVHEENIAITEGGSELLTIRAPREMPLVQGF